MKDKKTRAIEGGKDRRYRTAECKRSIDVQVEGRDGRDRERGGRAR